MDPDGTGIERTQEKSPQSAPANALFNGRRALHLLGYAYSFGVFLAALVLAAQFHLGKMQEEREKNAAAPSAAAEINSPNLNTPRTSAPAIENRGRQPASLPVGSSGPAKSERSASGT